MVDIAFERGTAHNESHQQYAFFLAEVSRSYTATFVFRHIKGRVEELKNRVFYDNRAVSYPGGHQLPRAKG